MKIAVTNEKEPFGLTVESGTYSPSYETRSGSIVTFSDAWVGSQIYPNASIVPVQSLNGQDKPYPPGGGKNLIGLATSPVRAQIANNVTINSQTDDSVSITSSSNTYACLRLFYHLKAGTYTLKYSATYPNNFTPVVSIYLYASPYTMIVGNIPPSTAGTFTIASDADVDIRLFATGATAEVNTIVFTSFQLESGSSATSYAPYSNICPITGYSSVDVSRCGKNLVSGKFESGSGGSIVRTVHDDGSITFSGTTTNTYTNRSANIDVTEGDVLHLSGCPSGGGASTWRLDVRDSAGTMLGNNYVDTGSGLTFTVPTGISQIQIGLRFGGGVVTDDIVMKPVLCFNSSLVTKTISLGSTYYGGILNVDSGVLTVTKVKHTVVSGDSVGLFQTGANANRVGVRVTDSQLSVPDSERLSIISNIAVANTSVLSSTNQKVGDCCMYSGGVDTYSTALFGVPSSCTDSASAKTWLIDNGCEFVYKLATPTTIQLTGEEITALLGENNVWASSGDVEVTYRKGGA